LPALSPYMRSLISALLFALAGHAWALDKSAVEQLAFGDAEEKTAALAALVAEGDARAAPLLEALSSGDVQTTGKRVLVVKGEEATDALTGEKVAPRSSKGVRRNGIRGPPSVSTQRSKPVLGSSSV